MAALPRTIFGYVRAHSWRNQLVILALTLSSLPFFYLWVELPKRIVDDALGGGPGARDFYGFEVSRLDYLWLLCLLFLVLVVVNGIFKYIINVYKGIVGERMLRRLRYELYGRILRFPPAQFRMTSQGQLVQMINAEVEPLGGFIGDAYSLPAYQGGMLLTILVFMFVQNPLMGFAAIALYPVQVLVIPRLQRQVNLLGKARVRQVRVLAEQIGETASGVDDIRANAATAFRAARFADELGKIFFIRLNIYKKKFFIKFLNNFLAQFAPFLFYSIGGYLVLQGELTIGAILAIVAAHEKLTSPWKELLTYYQMMWDSQIKYEQVVAQFDPDGLRPPLSDAPPEPVEPIAGALAARGVTACDLDGVRLETASFEIALPAHIAVQGAPGSGQSALLRAVAGLLPHETGSLRLGSHEVQRVDADVLGARVAYVGPGAHVFQGSVRDNLLLALKRHPRPSSGAAGGRRSARDQAEAVASANSPLDSAADWIDYAAAGCGDEQELEDCLARAVQTVRLEREVYGFGLRGTVDPAQAPDVVERVLEARRRFVERRRDDTRLARLVESFDPERFNQNATVAENLLFGTSLDPTYDIQRLPQSRYVRQVLREQGLDRELRRVGHALASTMVELFTDLPPDHEYFRRYSFIGADDLADYQALLGRVDEDQAAALDTGADAERLLALPMMLIPARHRLGLIDEALQDRLVRARHGLRAALPPAELAKIAFFEPDGFNRGASLQDNILFGRIALDQANAEATVTTQMAEIIDEMGLRRLILRVGLEAEAGVGGIRLSVAQRQKLALARALVRRPDVLVLDDATAVFDRQEQAALRDALLEAMAGRTVLWAHDHPEWIERFDRVIVLDRGHVAAVGTPAEIELRQRDASEAAE